MHFRLIEARQVHGFVLWLKFSDGVEGEIDLGDELDGPVFEPLKNAEVFKQFRIDPDLHTLVWPTEPILRRSFCMTTSVSPPNCPLHSLKQGKSGAPATTAATAASCSGG